ncbi:MAG TPA: oxidoreductase, partial [Methylophaga sp.]|nr:oxidoreductase [Methylophaga sp.]
AGIGFSIAKALADEGANVIVNGRSESSVKQAVESLKTTAKGTLHGFSGDLSLASEAEKLTQQYPRVDILINNLGIFEPVP